MNALIFGDSLILTAMLHGSGGVHNPLTGFYLLFIALAAMTLSGRSLCVLLVISIWHLPFTGADGVVGDGQ